MNYDIYNNYIIPFVSGTDITINIDLRNITEEPLENAVILSITWKMARYGESESLLTKTLDDGVEINENIITINLKSQDTANYSGFFVHQISIVDGARKIFNIDTGKILLHESLK